jgi:hydrogenase small subunit
MTTRRNFLRLAGATAAGGVITEYSTDIARALEQATDGTKEVVWFQGQSCTGCTISTLQAEYPTLEEALNAFRLQVTFHPTIMAPAGEAAIDSMSKEPDILIVEGSIPTEIPEAAVIGGKTAEEWVTELAPKADIVISVGNCASFGGWPAAENKRRVHDLGKNVTGAKGLQFEKQKVGGVLGEDFTGGAGLPVVNIAGCPPNPDYVLLTLATVLNGHIPELDEFQRPLPFYEPLVHDNCMHRGYFDRGEFADKPGGEGCLVKVGCKGPYTHCDDQQRLWNDGTSVCLNVSAPCIGCMEPAFWDRFSPFQQEMEGSAFLGNVDATDAGAAAVVAGAAGIGAHLGRRAMGYGKFEPAEEAERAEGKGD